MTTLAVIQARMGSRRLPGKVLMDLGGRPMLALMLERLAGLVGHGLTELVVATSVLPADDPVADVAQAAGARVVRGSEADVLGRFVQALDAHPAETVVRLTADCPLIDPGIISDALALHVESHAAYTSNTLVRTFPDGLDVEVMQADALRAAAEASDPPEREHVTPFIYRRPGRFALRALRVPDHLGEERWTIDTADDIADLRDVVGRLDDPVTSTWRDILAVTGRRGGPTAGQLWLRPLEPDDRRILESLDRAVPAELVADLADPSIRTWRAEIDGAAIGWLAVSVDGGVGRLARDVPAEHQDAAHRLLRRRLAADLQVVTLVEPD